MNTSFIVELFLRIENRLITLETEVSEMKSDLSFLRADVSHLSGFSSELDCLKRFSRFSKGFLLLIWGFITTAINLLIGRLIKN